MSDLTISAKLVAEGVGLPPVWRMDINTGPFVGPGYREAILEQSGRDVLGQDVWAGDSQTAFGLAMRLDEWEPHPLWTQAWLTYWRDRVLSPEPYARFMAKMLARIEHIGMDHAIRRALGWGVEPGTLAEISNPMPGLWQLANDTHLVGCWTASLSTASGLRLASRGRSGQCPTLSGITDPTEALRAIYAEVVIHS